MTSCREECPVCAGLRAATLEIVGADGIDALTADRLCLEAGVPRGELDAHYGTAQGCLIATYDEVAASIYEDFVAAFEAESDWPDALRLARDVLLERMAARPYEARFCFVEVVRGDHDLLRRRDASRRRLVALFMRELERRCENAELFRTQLELLIGAGFQAISAAVDEGDVAELPELGPELESRALVFAPVPA